MNSMEEGKLFRAGAAAACVHSDLGGANIPDYFAKILKNKDRIIRVQAKRIENLESEVERLRVSRETLSSQLALVSYKLELTTRAASQNSVVTSDQGRNLSVKAAGGKTNGNGVASASPRLPPQSACPRGPVSETSATSVSPSNVGIDHSNSQLVNTEHSALLEVDSTSAPKNENQIVEELSAKYGGYLRAKRAAMIIQQTFRQYSMSRSFAKLRLEAGESRRSRRFGRRRCLDDNNPSNEPTLVEGQSGSIGRTIPLESLHDDLLHDTGNVDLPPVLDPNSTCDIPIGSCLTSAVQSSPSDDVMNGERLFSDDGDSSRSLSPLLLLPPPMSASGDLPSVCFESSLEDEGAFRRHHIIGYGSEDGITSLFPPVSMPTDMDVKGNCSPMAYNISHMGDLRVTNNGGAVRHDRANMACMQHQVMMPCRADRASISEGCSQLRNGNTVSDNLFTSSFARFGITPNHSDVSPIWQRKSCSVESGGELGGLAGIISDWAEDGCEQRRHWNGSERPWSDLYPGSTTSSEDAGSIGSGGGIGSCANEALSHLSRHHTNYFRPGVECTGHDARHPSVSTSSSQPRGLPHCQVTDRQRKRCYRIGLNLFNKNPELGVRFLISQRFVDSSAMAVAKFLITRKGLSKLKIGEYLGNLQQRFNMDVLGCFSEEIDLSGMQVDEALRKFQSHFRMPGEAQKIERLMEAFAGCYCECNPEIVRHFHRADTIFLLAFAIIMLNTDLHNKSIKPELKMKLDDFIRNLRGIDGGEDIDRDLLAGIYDRTHKTPFRPAADHVTQVMKVEQMIVGKKPVLALPHRRLVCYCRLYEVQDPNKRDRSSGQHQREVFLFNDMLMITKSASKKKDNVMYSFRLSLPLCGMVVYIFETPYYQHGIQLSDSNSKVLATFCARNERDRTKFVEDLKEAILEMNEMAALEALDEVESGIGDRDSHRSSSSSVAATDTRSNVAANRLSAPECGSGSGETGINLHKSHTTSSLVNVSEGSHHSSSASLDSGLPSSTSSGSTGSCQESGHFVVKPPTPQPAVPPPQAPSSGNKFSLFAKKSRPSNNKLSPTSAPVEF